MSYLTKRPNHQTQVVAKGVPKTKRIYEMKKAREIKRDQRGGKGNSRERNSEKSL